MAWWRSRKFDVRRSLRDGDIVVTSNYVLEGAEAVAFAARFYSGEVLLVNAVTADTDEPIAVEFGHLVSDDVSLEEVRSIECGDLYVRDGNGPWRRHHFTSDADYDRLMAQFHSSR